MTGGIVTVLRGCGRLRSVVTVLNVRRLSSRSGTAIVHTEGVRGFLSRPFFMTRAFAKVPKGCMPLGRAVHKFGVVVSKRVSTCPRGTFFGIKAVSSMVTGTGRVRRRWLLG